MNEELIEEILDNGFDVYEALEKYNLEIMDDEIVGYDEEIEMFLQEMISEVGLTLTREFIFGQEETEKILEDMLRAEEEGKKQEAKDAQISRELSDFDYEIDEEDEEEVAREVARLEEEHVKEIQEKEEQRNEEIKAEIIERIKNNGKLDINEILRKIDDILIEEYDLDDLKIVDGEIVGYDYHGYYEEFVLLDAKEVIEVLKESKFEIFKKETDYSNYNFRTFYLENYFLLNMKLSDEQRRNIFENINKYSFVDDFCSECYINYEEDFIHYFVYIDSLEEQEKLNFIKGAIYLIYYVLDEVSATRTRKDHYTDYYDPNLEKIKKFNYIISTSKNFVQEKIDEYADNESKKYLYNEYSNILSDLYKAIDKQIKSREFCNLPLDMFEYFEDMGFTSNEIFELALEYGSELTEELDFDETNQKTKFEFLLQLISANKIIPEFFKQDYPEMVLADKAPNELKDIFYEFSSYKAQKLIEHPEWDEFLKGKIPPGEYIDLINTFGSDILNIKKLCIKSPEAVAKVVQNHKETVLKKWYDAVGGKFIPHYIVVLNFPEDEIDSFLANSKKWSRLMQLKDYSLNDNGKMAMLKAAYTMGVFKGDDSGFNKLMKLFTDIPQELSQEEYCKVIDYLSNLEETKNNKNIREKNNLRNIFEKSYNLSSDERYVLKIDKQKNKSSVATIRKLLEDSQISKILTQQKAHQIFDSFSMEYNPDFVKFFNENIEEILSNSEYTKDIATIQRQFKDIVRTNAGRQLTLDVAEGYIRSIIYTDIEVGNEEVAEQAKIAGYSQEDFETIQSLFNEGEMRDFSSIPRIQGKTVGYTYEMLRLDDPLALTIGTLTDCCQEIKGAGETSMEHSVVSPDGRVFCIKDEEGRIVAQSWVWRNQYTVCFDNIEIPDRIFKLYRDLGIDLTTNILEVYKKAAQDLMKEDERVYKELLKNGTITQEQYDALLLGKVTIGLGYNDIAETIEDDKTIHEEADTVSIKSTRRLPNPYTDSRVQYTVAERDKIIKSEHENLYIYQDDIPVFDGTNITNEILLTMERMGLEYEEYDFEEYYSEDFTESQKIINNIAEEYELVPEYTKVIATKRIALIYSKNENEIQIADLLSSPIRNDITDKQKQTAKTHIRNQVKNALKQIGVGEKDSKIDLSSLNDEQIDMIQSIIKEIEKENEERGEK